MKLAGIFLCVLLTVIPQATSSLSAESTSIASVWVAFGEDVLRMNAEDASLLLRIPELTAIRRIGLDESRSTLWAYGNKTLLKFNLNGQIQLSVPVPLPAGALEDVIRLKVNPADGTLWLSVGPYLWKFSNQGGLILPLTLPKNIYGLSLDSANSRLWVATDKKVYRKNIHTGAQEVEFSIGQEQIKDIDAELSTGNLWVAADKNIYRFGPTGTNQLKKSFKDAILIVSDHAAGAWIGANKKLIRINSAGNTLKEIQPFNSATDLGSILSIVADPRDSSVWAANQNKLLRINVQGNIVYSLIFRGSLLMTDRIRDLALSLTAVETHVPVISFEAPVNDAIIETRTPQIKLNYSDQDNDLDLQSLQLMANSNDDLTSTCIIEISSATCSPLNPLPEGPNVLTARIKDEAGNVSNSAQVNFTITIAPDPNDVDDDGDGVTENQGDCNDTESAIHPGATEVCNSIDDNCNDLIDEGNVCNQPPFFTSTPGLEAIVGQQHGYDAEASDPNAGDLLTFSLNTAPDGMTLDPASGLIEWTPNQEGIADVELKVTDSGNLSATQTYQITISAPPNRAPNAFDDRYAVRRKQTLTVDAPGVLENDLDPDEDTLTSALDTNVSKGNLDFSSDGSFVYTPNEPAANSTEPVLKFTYDEVFGTSGGSTRTQPLVLDLDLDGMPEIIFTSTGEFSNRRLIAVHGNGTRYFSINAFQHSIPNPIVLGDSFSEMAAGDIDNDGYPEIIGVDAHDGGSTDTFRKQLLAFEHDGTYKWTSQDVLSDPLVDSTFGFTKPLIANVIGDSFPEIVVGYSAIGPLAPFPGRDFVTVYNNQGQIVWTAFGSGSNADGSSGNVVVADINLDGNVEILYGDDVFDRNGNRLWSAATCTSCSPRVLDVAVANLDDDPFAEIVYLDQSGNTYAHEHTGARKWGPIANAGTGISGITIGDTDGDGTVEILITRDPNICVISRDGTVLRKIPIPFSPGFSGGGTAIFDLNGDGKPELIHNGPRGPFDTPGRPGALYIFDGPTGTLLHSIQATRSGGAQHIPVVADVDGDGAAEIVTGGINELLHVFEAKNGNWSRARAVYNQISYHATNVNENGTIPANEAINWLTPGLNNHRINIPLPEERNGQDTDIFTYKANDGELDSNAATVTIDILPPNTAPTILSLPMKTASLNLEYLYAVRAVDPDAGEILTFALPQGPTGMTIDSTTGVIRWTPAASQSGSHLVAVKVTDSQGEFAFQGFTIQVVGTVTVPSVVNQPQAAAESTILNAGLILGTITHSSSSTVPAGDVISQEPVGGTSVSLGSPVNLVISSGQQAVTVPNVVNQTQTVAITNLTSAGLTTGTITTSTSAIVPAGSVISQNPSAGTSVPLGSEVDLVISTGNISLENLASIIVNPEAPIILVGDALPFNATGIFNDGTSLNITSIATWISDTPSISTISSNGTATGVSEGSSNISASINSITGNTLLTVAPKVPGDSTPPTAEITAPAHNSSVTGPVSIIGTATDDNFLKYELEYAPAGESNFTLIQTGNAPVSNGTLGSFDPTVLLNDLYTIRLTVFDQGGNQTSASVAYQLDGNWKVGLFTVAFNDFSIGMTGLPIVVNRVYDSRDKRPGDFGIGWRLDVQTMKIRTNRALGTGWVRSQSGFLIVLQPTDEHKVSVILPDGTVEEFDMVVSPTSNIGSLDATSVTGFTARPGTLGKLEVLGNKSLLILNAGVQDELVDDETFNTYNPQLFRYTRLDGTTIEIHRTEGVKKIIDRNGNVLTFSANGITHSSGPGMSFIRDSQGRITQISDPAGNTRQYAYDSNGDLMSSIDQVGGVTHYTYNRMHDLLDIHDPAGNRGIRNEYDEDGRLIATEDAQGNRVTFTHNLSAQEEVITNTRGAVRKLVYDAKGNILASEEAVTIDGNLVNAVTNFTYDLEGNETSRIDADGLQITSTYVGNLIASQAIDPNNLNLQTSFTYNGSNDLTDFIDPGGRTFAFTYDTNGNVTEVNTPITGVATSQVNSQGLPTRIEDTLGNFTVFTRDGAGRVIREEMFDIGSNLLRRTNFTYNANGNKLTETLHRKVDGVVTPLTTQYSYDEANRLVSITNPAGGVTTIEYDAVGNEIARTDELGRRTTFTYDILGRRTAIIYPNDTFEAFSYDSVGNLISETDRAGRTTTFEYDELNRQVKTILPDGSFTRVIYTPGGRVAATIDAKGHRTDYSYDSAGRRINTKFPEVQNGSAGSLIRPQISFSYNSLNAPAIITDPNGRQTTYQYNAAGYPTRITFADGTFIEQQFDVFGRRISIANEEGQTTNFTYDGLGRIVGVSGLAGIASYTYDEANNPLTLTDALGRVTKLQFDVLNHLVHRQYPGGQAEDFAYDAAGNLISHTNPKGQTINFTYDSINQLIRKDFPTGSSITYNYGADGRRSSIIDSRGSTSYEYNSAGRLSKVIHPGGEVIVYTYDANGNLASLTSPAATTSFHYDAMNRLVQVNSPEGQAKYFYDPAGNKVRLTGANGVTTDYAHDLRNRPTQLTLRNIAGTILQSLTNVYSPAGRRTNVTEMDGSAENYTYDSLGRLISEVRTGSNPFNIVHTYDSVGNRTQVTKDGISTSFTYDVNDRLISDGTATYTYDANGNLINSSSGASVTQYSYDAENRLLAIDNATGLSQFVYDADGNRVQTNGPAGATNFLIDTENNTGLSQVLEETNSTGNLLARYTYGDDLLSMLRGGTPSFYHYDAHGSTRSLTSAAGAITDQYTYEAYGRIAAATGTTVNPYLYSGERFDVNSALYQLRARYYHPQLGRFISRDPFAGRLQSPVSLHRYLYANADPVNFIDPTGESTLVELSLSQIISNTMKFIEVGSKLYKYCEISDRLAAVGQVIMWGGLAGTALLGFDGAGIAENGKSAVSMVGINPIQGRSDGLKKIEIRLEFKKNRVNSIKFAFEYVNRKREDVTIGLGVLGAGTGYNKDFPCTKCGLEIGKATLKARAKSEFQNNILDPTANPSNPFAVKFGLSISAELNIFFGLFRYDYPIYEASYSTNKGVDDSWLGN